MNEHSFAMADLAKLKKLTRNQGDLVFGIRKRTDAHDPAQVLRVVLLVLHVAMLPLHALPTWCILYYVTKHTMVECQPNVLPSSFAHVPHSTVHAPCSGTRGCLRVRWVQARQPAAMVLEEP